MLGNIIGGLMSLAISSIVLANVFIPIVKDANTTDFSSGELALWGVVTLIAEPPEWRYKIPEKNWNAETQIRGEDLTKLNQPQRIGVEKIQYSHEAGKQVLITC
jgi:hypothetical protein